MIGYPELFHQTSGDHLRALHTAEEGSSKATAKFTHEREALSLAHYHESLGYETVVARLH